MRGERGKAESGAILLYRIPRVLIGEHDNFVGGEDLLHARDVEVVVLDNGECKELMAKLFKEKPGVCQPRICRRKRYKLCPQEWNEDIGGETPDVPP